MYIQSFQIDGFGTFQGITLENIPQGLSIFLGKNEAGKSTLLHFLQYMLVGCSGNKKNTTIKNYLKDHSRGGGNLIVTTKQQGIIHLSRKSKSSLILTDNYGNIVQPYIWENIFHGITQEVYNNIYSFSLNELQEFNSLSSEGVRNALYGASFGTEISSPSVVIKELNESMKAYITSRSTKKFDKALEALEKTTYKIKDIKNNIIAYDNTQYALATLKKQKDNIENTLKDLEQQASTLEKKINCWGKWIEWQKHQAELKHLSIPKKFPHEGLSCLKEYLKTKNEKIEQIEIVTEQLKTIQHKIQVLHINTTLLEIEPELLSALAYKASFITAEQTITSLNLTLEKKEAELQQHLAYLGEDWSIEKVQQTDHSLAIKEQFRNINTEVQEAKDNYETVCKNITDTNEKLNTIQKKGQEAYNTYNDLFISKNKESPDNTCKIWLRELRDTFIQYEKTLAISRIKLHNAEQNKPLKVPYILNFIKLLGLLSIIGGVTSIFLPYFYTTIPYIPINTFISKFLPKYFLLGIGIVIFITLFMYRRYTSSKYFKKIEQFSSDYQEVAPLKQKLQELCSQMNVDFEEISTEYINTLEDKFEHEQHQHIQAEMLKEKLHALQEEKQIYEQKYNDIYTRWNTHVKKCNLQSGFSYSAIEAALNYMNAIENLHLEYMNTKKTIQQHEKNKNAFIMPLKNIAQKLNKPLTDQVNWITFFANISKELDEAKKLHSQKEHLKEKEKNLEENITKTDISLKNADKKIKELLNAAEANDVEDFFLKGDHQQRYEEIQQSMNHLKDFFTYTFGNITIDIASFLNFLFKKEDLVTIENNHKKILSQIDAFSEQKNVTDKEIHEQEASLKTLASSKELSQYRIEESKLKNSVNEDAKQWSCYALAKELLMEAKSHFEQERQPEIIRTASTIFKTITNDKWQGINASLEDMSLNVIPAYGEPFDTTKLSRGTQEQLYLALRLAHIHNHATQATPLPVIMDDILVNFDQERALHTIKTFMKLLETPSNETEGHQIFFFTCHEHTAKQIQETIPNSTLYTIEHQNIILH